MKKWKHRAWLLSNRYRTQLWVVLLHSLHPEFCPILYVDWGRSEDYEGWDSFYRQQGTEQVSNRTCSGESPVAGHKGIRWSRNRDQLRAEYPQKVRRRSTASGRGRERKTKRKMCNCILAVYSWRNATPGIILRICQAHLGQSIGIISFWCHENSLWVTELSQRFSKLRKGWEQSCSSGVYLQCLPHGVKYIFIIAYTNSHSNEEVRVGVNIIKVTMLSSSVSSQSLWEPQDHPSSASFCVYWWLPPAMPDTRRAPRKDHNSHAVKRKEKDLNVMFSCLETCLVEFHCTYLNTS